MSYKDKFIFTITPAPTAVNQSKIEWRGFLDADTQDIVIFDDSTNSELFRIGSGGGIYPTTYSDLLIKKTTGALIQGRQYLITDFATRYIIPNTSVVNTGPIEPLIVVAASSTELNCNAISALYPKDQILYELIDSTTSGGNKGRIYYRKDTLIAISTYYNWRVIQFRRWNDGTGNYTSVTDNGNAFLDFYTFNNSSTAFGCSQTEIGPITDFGIIDYGAPTDLLNNFVVNGPCFDNTIGQDVFDSTMIGVYFAANKLVGLFFNNIIIGGQIVSNTIGAEFNDNVIGEDFRDNVIAGGFIFNQISDGFSHNTLNNTFIGNTIGTSFQNQTVSTGFIYNIIGNDYQNNIVGVDFQGNIIGDSFNSNEIDSSFQNNIFQNGTVNNYFKNNFNGNVNIGNDFRLNNIESGLNGVDFGAATHVYGDYTVNIFKNSALNYRLSYTDGADVIQYGAPNS